MIDRIETLESLKPTLFAAEKLDLAAKIKGFLDTTAEINLGDIGTLYPNQLTAINKLYQFLVKPDADDIGYIVQPTGSGKTLIMALIVKLFDVDTLMLVPRINLLEYTKRELISLGIAAEDIGIVGGGYNEVGRKITLSTYQSHLNRVNDAAYQQHNQEKKFIVCDEAHTALGDKTRASISQILTADNDVELDDIADEEELRAQEAGLTQVTTDYHGKAFILGFTATPQLAGKHVKAYFKNEIAREGIVNLMKGGILAKLRVAQLSGDIQRGVEINGKKITQDQQEKILTRNDAYKKLLDEYEKIFQAMLEEDQIPRAVARCSNIKEAGKFVDLLIARGFKAELCTSKDEDAKTSQQQRKKLEALEEAMLDGKLDVIVTVDKLAMGWNFPLANIAIDATASASAAKIIQFVGRILRRAKNKQYATLICMSWLVQRAKQRNPNDEGAALNESPSDSGADADEGEATSRGQLYDFFRALQDSGEDLDEMLSVLADASGRKVIYDRDNRDDMKELGARYFSSVENIAADLKKYADIGGVSVTECSTRTPDVALAVICANGEPVKWATYLKYASIAFGLESLAATLLKLKKLIGLVVKEYEMDEVYFKCAACVKSDLQKFVDTAGIPVAKANTRTPDVRATVVCSNGDTIKWENYLNIAARVWGESSPKVALDRLKSIALEVKEPDKLDAKYFAQSSNVLHDLSAFAKGFGLTTDTLTTTSNNTLLVTCANGEVFKWTSYLRQAAKALGLESLLATLLRLKKMIGLEVKEIEMDEMYFRCADCVRNDFQRYAKAAGIPVEQINTRTPDVAMSVICSNGDTVRWQRYFSTAKKTLRVDSDVAAIAQLKTLIGLEVKQYDPLDAKYFAQKSNVLHDLSAFANTADVTIGECTTRTPDNKVKIVCANGEPVSWDRYLMKAGKALGINGQAQTLVYLKSFVLDE